MSMQSESTLPELQRAQSRHDRGRHRSGWTLDRPDHGRVLGMDEDAAADAVTRNAVPVILVVLAIIALAVVALGTWSWLNAA